MMMHVDVWLCLSVFLCGVGAAWALQTVPRWARRRALLSIYRGVREARLRLLAGPWSPPHTDSQGKE